MSPKDALIEQLTQELKTKQIVIREILKMVNWLESENDSLRQKLRADS